MTQAQKRKAYAIIGCSIAWSVMALPLSVHLVPREGLGSFVCYVALLGPTFLALALLPRWVLRK